QGVMAYRAGEEDVPDIVRLEPISVDVDIALPPVRDIVLEEDGVYGADGIVGGAVDAGLGVDVILLVFLRAMDAVDRADVDAGGVFDADAGLGDDVSHGFEARATILSGGGQGHKRKSTRA